MTRYEIISMAIDAWRESSNGWGSTAWFHDRAEEFEAFARKVEARVAAAEREACAKFMRAHGMSHITVDAFMEMGTK